MARDGRTRRGAPTSTPPKASNADRPSKKAQRPVFAPLKVDEEKFPNYHANPGLERALRIRQALEKGKPREEAVQLADQAMGRPTLQAVPARKKSAARPARVKRRS